MKALVTMLIVVLAILHQDFWWWNTADPMIFGFLPIGLAYHAAISLAAGILWALAVRFCWPEGLDDEDEEQSPAAGEAS